MGYMKKCILLAGSLIGVLFLQAQVRLPAIFADHMVLQEGKRDTIWGWASPGTRVSVRFRGKESHALTSGDARWRMVLPAGPAGGPFTMTINEYTLTDIWVGDVWLASGQSNMEFGIQTDSASGTTIPDATDSLIHFFYVPMATATTPFTDISRPVSPLDGKWVVCSPSLLEAKWAWHGFSAVAYYFARQLRAATHKPIGLIGSYKGGTRAEQWMPSGDYYNAMINPLLSYGIKGVIWYQGESNGDRLTDALGYKDLFPALIQDWRTHWGDVPFLYVQLPNFRAPARTPSEGNWPWVREAQQSALALPHTGMAVTIDLGDPGNIHPRDKKDVGERLALVARRVVYGEQVVDEGPRYVRMEVEGEGVRVYFTGSPAAPSAGASLNGFCVAGSDRRFYPAKAVISDNNTVLISSDHVPNPVAVRYDWADNPNGNLYNREGLPAAPFRTDDWHAGTETAAPF